MISCREVSRLISSGNLERERLWTRLTVKAHLFVCGSCSSFASQIQRIGSVARERFREHTPDHPKQQETAEDRILRKLLDKK